MQERDRAIRRDRRSREDERVAGIIRAQGAAAAMALMQMDPAAQMAARAQAVAESINALPEVRAAVGQQRGAELAHRIQSHRAELQIQRAATAAESRMLANPVLRGSYARVAQAAAERAAAVDAEMERIEAATAGSSRRRASNPGDAERRVAARSASQAAPGGAARSSQAREGSLTDRRESLTRQLANRELLVAPSPNWPAGVSAPPAQFAAANVPMANFGEQASSSTAPQFMERPGGTTGEPQPASSEPTTGLRAEAEAYAAARRAGASHAQAAAQMGLPAWGPNANDRTMYDEEGRPVADAPRVRAPRMPQPPEAASSQSLLRRSLDRTIAVAGRAAGAARRSRQGPPPPPPARDWRSPFDPYDPSAPPPP